ncbi:hypothetical protein TCAL_03242 [Tigriopus californicus]|uniref:Chitin-binding type-2 domain-containing protein n=1 Tax=Tigriopus californicus TaxID=6832 RepID=A0A553NTB1_TIGCA|nr:U-scoloptoxin(01)-Cw1a-like [Tigriopus californicus]TRY68672.1 hypothetical protein TCAL_03242 [Tigriopus californicus]|eukprot:TCALIF_03242-PA protein Name:"Protein of unknown function" AED:0.33 eAED:0.33 QI:0/-1/0/1/-1/1/1/0/136
MNGHFTFALATVALMASMYVAVAMPQAPSGAGGAYQFPSEAESILSTVPVVESFTCEGQAYGYYADVANNCEVFHICLPIEDDAGAVIEYAQWSFVCGNGTIFDQQTLTCNYPTDAFPCEEAASLYGAVEFGKIEE